VSNSGEEERHTMKRTVTNSSDEPTAPSFLKKPISRRDALRELGVIGLASAASLSALEALTWKPERPVKAAGAYPDIQFDTAAAHIYIDPATGLQFNLPPVFTMFITASLTSAPTKASQKTLAGALDTIEAAYPFGPSGVITIVNYGMPYFNRLPSSLVAAYMPRLASDSSRYAVEEATPAPTDYPAVSKPTYNLPVRIETNDLVFMFRSDELGHLRDVFAWLHGSNRLNGAHTPSPGLGAFLKFTSTRLMFVQIGLPRKLADNHSLPYSSLINPNSPMWMGYSSQQAGTAAPAQLVTFQGVPTTANSATVYATAPSGAALTASDYFWNGSMMHLAHDIIDLARWYSRPDMPYAQRAAQMFRADPQSYQNLFQGNADQFTDGGGTAYLPNEFLGAGDAVANAQAGVMGHVPALQRGARVSVDAYTPDGTNLKGVPLHVRTDGPGFDALDVPDSSEQPKLQFAAFLPTSEKFRAGRVLAASMDLTQQYNIPLSHNGVESFITATRRQNFLCPPRSHRAFPLVDLT
jgi:hypothetical protein